RPGQLLIDQQPGAPAVRALGLAAWPGDATVAPTGDDDVAIAEQTVRPVAAPHQGRAVRAEQQPDLVGVRHEESLRRRCGSRPGRVLPRRLIGGSVQCPASFPRGAAMPEPLPPRPLPEIVGPLADFLAENPEYRQYLSYAPERGGWAMPGWVGHALYRWQ